MKATRYTLLVSIFILVACSNSAEDNIKVLDDNRRLWNDVGGSYSYNMHYRRKNGEIERNVQIHVRQHEVVSVISLNEEWLKDKTRFHNNIENLMDWVEYAIEDEGTQVDVKYHQALGYPISIRTWETGQLEFDISMDIADLHFGKQ